MFRVFARRAYCVEGPQFFVCVCPSVRPCVRPCVRPSDVLTLSRPLLNGSDGAIKGKSLKNGSKIGPGGPFWTTFLKFGSRLEILPNRFISSFP